MAQKTCPNCGLTIEAGNAHGLCPACLMQQAMGEETAVGQECSNCHALVGFDAQFCARCGTAVMPPASDDPLRHALEAKLAGQYRVLRLLGHGGMGSVYLARDLTLEREVAIKVVKPASDSRSLYDRFRREAKTAAKLAHPNIVPLHAFGEVGGMPYFVMGYVRGESLADRLRREGRMPEEEVRRIVVEIADALDHAHRQGVVHRDVKPDNVLLEDASGRALLTDFGVAKAINQSEALTQYGSVVGTPHYMSPEQAAGRADIDGRSDIYSLGIMAYAMVAGRLPHDGNTAAEILSKHLTQDPPPLRSLAPSASDSTVQAIARCMAKEPAARWPDARSLKLAMGAAEDSHLPDALQSVDGRGLIGLVVAAIWLSFVFAVVRSGAPPAVFAINAGIVTLLYVFVIFGLWREGISVFQAHRILWREPSWWLWWYPRPLRRPGNVWQRLPAAVRRLRSILPAFVLFFAATFLVGDFPNLYRSPAAFIMKIGGLVGWIVAWSVLTFRASSVLRQSGLSRPDARRVMVSVPPSRSSFWTRPHIAPILASAQPGDATRRSDSPHEHLQAILRDGNDLSGPLRPLAEEAAVAARQLVASIQHSENQIADLARNVEPGEEKRLVEKIDALGTSDEAAAMRSLLDKQLELIRGLNARIEEAKESRSRHVEMLKTLALHMASLRARLSETPSEVKSLSDTVRALCDNIGEQALTVKIDDLATVDRRSALAWLAITLTLAIAGDLRAKDEVRVLFIGNSYTYLNDLPRMMEELAASAHPPRFVKTEIAGEGGATLQRHWEAGRAVETIRKGAWDFVVLQEQGTLGQTTNYAINAPATFHEYARKFDGEIRKSGARTVLLMTWARKDAPRDQALLTDAYTKIGAELKAMVVPAGIAWQHALREHPAIPLHAPDHSHPAPAGSYLTACVLYAALFGSSPQGLSALSLAEADARSLQRIAARPNTALPPTPEVAVVDQVKTPSVESLEQGRRIFAFAQQAAGGVERLRAIQETSVSYSGTIRVASYEMPITSRDTFTFPTTLLTVATLPSGQIATFFDGKGGWRESPQGKGAISERMIGVFRAQVTRHTLNLLRGEGSFTVAFEKREKVGNAEADILLVNKNDEMVRLFVDAATGLILKKAFRGIGTGGPASIEEIYSDYREIEGVKLPFRMSVTQNGTAFLEATVTEATLLVSGQ